MRIEPEISGVSIVLLGDFNPAIFTPAWFALHGLLPKSVAENADLGVAHPQLLEFSAEWLDLSVGIDRFSIDTARNPYERIRDLTVHVFKECLPHTPLKAIGINRYIHFCVETEVDRDQIGRILAPVEPWGDIGKKLNLDGRQGGMLSLTMAQFRPEGRPSGGQIRVTVEPSARITNRQIGIYVGVNDHYAIGNAGADGRSELLGFLENDFMTSIERSDSIVDHVMSLATDHEGGTT